MKKKVFALLYLLLTLAVLVSAVSAHLRAGRKWPAAQEEYESMVTRTLGSVEGIREISGAAGLTLHPAATYTEGEVIVRTEGNYLLPLHGSVQFDMELAVERIGRLRDYCSEQGIPFLYVSYPSKASYTDSRPAEDFGIRSVDRETRSLFLRRIRETGIPVLDIEGVLRDRGIKQEEVFYLTDHHWRTRVGLIAAKETAEALKTDLSLDVHPELLEEGSYHATEYPYRWLGESGRKVSALWAGTLDGYTLYEPDYATAFEYYVPAAKIQKEGSFSDFIDTELFRRKPDLYRESLHYIYMKDSQPVTWLRNRSLSGARVLMIKDSFAVPVAPFLAAATGELCWWDMRKNSDKVYDYIKKHSFDAVVIAYTDFWRDEMYDFRKEDGV